MFGAGAGEKSNIRNLPAWWCHTRSHSDLNSPWTPNIQIGELQKKGRRWRPTLLKTIGILTPFWSWQLEELIECLNLSLLWFLWERT